MTYLTTEPAVALAHARRHDFQLEAARARRLAELRPGRPAAPILARLAGWTAPFRPLRGGRAFPSNSPAAA